MPPVPKYRSRHDRVAQFSPYTQPNVAVHKSKTMDRIPIPGGYRLKKHSLSVETVYGKRGRAGPPVCAIRKHKDIEKSVVTILYGNPANDAANDSDRRDAEDSTDGESSDGDSDATFDGDTIPPSSDSESGDDSDGDDDSAMDITPPPIPDFRRRAISTVTGAGVGLSHHITAAGPSRRITAAGPSRRITAPGLSRHITVAAQLGPKPYNIIDLTKDDN